jgi:hypothetical protein
MSHPPQLAAVLAALAIAAPPLRAADNPELTQLRQEMDAMRQDYEARMQALEARLRAAEASAGAPSAPVGNAGAAVAAAPAPAAPAPSAPPPAAGPAPTAQASAGSFNPAIGLVLAGSYGWLSQDPSSYRFQGFLTGGEIGPGVQGFSLGESELNISANVDPWFYGQLTVALTADNEAEVEEAYVQTTALPHGLTLRAGRTLSSIGYMNDKHAHTWDFADAPLVYQAFLDGQLKVDGLQFRALLPTTQFVEIGSEVGAAGPFPSGSGNGNQPGLATVFAHTGGDVGASSSWRAGLSYLWAKSNERESTLWGRDGTSTTGVFDGSTRMLIADAVWKWAPNGNPQRTNLTLQGEYLRRVESGSLTYDPSGVALGDSYKATQSGWYTQAVYQFMPAWRVGLRYDQLDIGNVEAAGNGANLVLPDRSPSRGSLMVDWSPSEFSRVRLQYARDRAGYDGLTDNQFILQYQMSLGAHGAHNY